MIMTFLLQKVDRFVAFLIYFGLVKVDSEQDVLKQSYRSSIAREIELCYSTSTT
jgi:hypothetical protein